MLLLAILWACSSADSVPASVPAPVEADADAERTALKAHMQGHLTAVKAVRDALVRCDLDRAKQANREFLDHKLAADLPGDWVSHVAAMGEAAVALDKATELPAAAKHAAEVVAACGACHEAVAAEVEVPTQESELVTAWMALVTGPVADAPTPDAAAKLLLAAAPCRDAAAE